jgi:membrane protease YdiL (CAAX protease family)
MAAFGPDFLRARRKWLYDLSARPNLLVALISLVGLFILMAVFQTVFGFAVYFLQNGFGVESFAEASDAQNNFAKATIVGMLPSGILTALAAWWLARVSYAPENRGMPLHVPRLGFLGWAAVILGFIIGVYVLFFALFSAMGIDPQDYMPKSGGVNDDQSMAGLVEKVLADMVSEPFLFAIALPGVTIAMPMAEELVFRGPIFAAIASSRAGRWGAVILTSAGWALIHMTAPWIFVAIIFMMGLILGTLLLRFGSLWVTIVCHCIWNSMSSLAIFGSQNLPGSP